MMQVLHSIMGETQGQRQGAGAQGAQGGRGSAGTEACGALGTTQGEGQ